MQTLCPGHDLKVTTKTYVAAKGMNSAGPAVGYLMRRLYSQRKLLVGCLTENPDDKTWKQLDPKELTAIRANNKSFHQKCA